MLAKFTWDHLLRTILAFLKSTNWILWRAWGDKLLLRYKARKNEKALDWGELRRLIGRLLG